MFPYVVSISITDSTGSDKQLFHTDLYNYMPYFSAGMPDIKILLPAAPAHILPQAVPRHTADNCILPRNLPAIPYRFLSPEHHTFHETVNSKILFLMQHVPRSSHKADPKTHRSAARTL